MGHKILLADDSITIQKVIELTFSDEDFELHTVGNGQKAIDEIRSIMPHIVLCDIIMPEKNGYEVCEFIKTSADLKHIPVLLLTGAFEPFDQERARTAGCDGFLAKPFEPQTLISKVKELLARAPVASAPKPFVAQPMEVADERTVIMPPVAGPTAMPPAPPRGPQVAASAPPPPPPAADYGA
ncbi:MAG: response regulator, partial [Vicinamibacteria bacterium]